MSKVVHTCVRVRDIDASVRFYEALGFERRGKLQFQTAYNIYMGLPGDGDTLELTVNMDREEPYDLGEGYNHMAMTVDDIHATVARAGRAGHRAREAAVPSGRARGGRHDLLRGGSRRLPDRADRRADVAHPSGPLSQVP